MLGGGRILPLPLACAALFAGCCLDISGQATRESSSGGASTGGTTSSGTSTGASELFWIGGQEAIDLRNVVASEAPVAALTCPGSSPLEVAVVDRQGNLWRAGQTPSGLEEWTPAQQALSCSVEPTVSFFGFIVAINAMAFDSHGNLWVADFSSVSSFGPATLSEGGDGQPDLVMTWGCEFSTTTIPLDTFCDAIGLAFDSSGYLWVGSKQSLIAYSPGTLSQIQSPGSAVPGDFFLTTPEALDGGLGGYDYRYLAFDAQSNLWVTVWDGEYSQILEFSWGQLQELRRNPTPAPILAIPLAGDGDGGVPQLDALAFDAEGNLWVGAQWIPDQGLPAPPNLYRFPPSSLVTGGTPDLALNVPGMPWTSLAVSPIPPGLPIQP